MLKGVDSCEHLGNVILQAQVPFIYDDKTS